MSFSVTIVNMFGRKTLSELLRLSEKLLGLVAVNITENLLAINISTSPGRRIRPSTVVVPVISSINLRRIAMENVNRAQCSYETYLVKK
jgi:hypothetical protein